MSFMCMTCEGLKRRECLQWMEYKGDEYRSITLKMITSDLQWRHRYIWCSSTGTLFPTATNHYTSPMIAEYLSAHTENPKVSLVTKKCVLFWISFASSFSLPVVTKDGAKGWLAWWWHCEKPVLTPLIFLLSFFRFFYFPFPFIIYFSVLGGWLNEAFRRL